MLRRIEQFLDRFIWTSLAALAVVFGLWHGYNVLAEEKPTGDYQITETPAAITMTPGASTTVKILLKNTGDMIWNPTQINLGTVYHTGDTDRPSVWKTASWASATRILPINRDRDIVPGQLALFQFDIQAPVREGMYKEEFRPVLDGVKWMEGAPVALNIQVGNVLQAQSLEAREIRIYRPSQQADILENGVIVATLPISSGKVGYETPKGNYKIYNHIPVAYSKPYDLYMDNWMALSNETRGVQGYGLHSLPYWKVNPKNYVEGKIYPGGRLYTQGKLYEGASHLGRPVSHGCIRFGLRESRIISNWAQDGDKVVVV